MDKQYNTIEDAKEAILKRTMEDIERYKRLAEELDDPWLKSVYEKGWKAKQDLLNLALHDPEQLRNLEGYNFIDNSRDLNYALEQILLVLNKK